MLNEKKINYFIDYINTIVSPATQEFQQLLRRDQVKLHHAFSLTTILTHAIDYMVLIDHEINNRSRAKLIDEFDEIYSVHGAKYLNQKFKLLDAVNNAFKHVELDQKRYKPLIEKYGLFTLYSLVEQNNKVYFIHDNYKFDYCRIVLKPIAAIFNCGLATKNDVIKFMNAEKHESAHEDNIKDDYYQYYDHSDDIDRMINYCNPQCFDCGEYQNKCECDSFFYANQKPEANLDIDKNFDLKKTMAKISGTR